MVTVVNVDKHGEVLYEWEQAGKKVQHAKSAFAFQCRYCLIEE